MADLSEIFLKAVGPLSAKSGRDKVDRREPMRALRCSCDSLRQRTICPLECEGIEVSP
jgi:hypothetical protein